MSLVKIAAPLGAFISAGKTLLQNKVVRNSLIGSGVGAAAGAIQADSGQRMSGALKGGLVGAAAGGIGTSGFNMYKNLKNPGIGPKMTFGGAFRSEGASIKNAFSATGNKFKQATDVLNRQKMKVGTEGRTKLKSAEKFTSYVKPKPGEQGSAMHNDMFSGGQE